MFTYKSFNGYMLSFLLGKYVGVEPSVSKLVA